MEESAKATIPLWLPFITGLIGALLGLAGSVVTVWIQNRSQERRDRVRLAVDRRRRRKRK